MIKEDLDNRAKKSLYSWDPELARWHKNEDTRCSYDAGFHCGAVDQEKIDFWKARKVFCKVTCGECPLHTDDIEGGGGLVVQCDKLEMFDKELKKEYGYKTFEEMESRS